MTIMIQIRNVPNELHREMKSRAALAGMSLSDYLLNEIRHIAERPTLSALRARLERYPDTSLSISPAEVIRAERDPYLIVTDASVLLEVLLRTPAAKAIERRLFAPEQTLHAPHLLDVEAAQVIRRYAAHGDITGERGRAVLTDLADFPLQRYPHIFLLSRIWALRNNLTAYDAAYVALAEALDAVLLTRDKRLATAAGHHARIELA